jgi:hypothetical protein
MYLMELDLCHINDKPIESRARKGTYVAVHWIPPIGKPIRLFRLSLKTWLGSKKRSDLHKFMAKYSPEAMTAVLIAGSIIEDGRL